MIHLLVLTFVKETSSVVEATHKIVKKRFNSYFSFSHHHYRRCKFVLGHDEQNGRILLANFSDETKEPVSDFWKKLFMGINYHIPFNILELGALLAKNGVL